MPLNERDYVRGRHPRACTCTSCVSGRLRNWRAGQGRGEGRPRAVSPDGLRGGTTPPNRRGRRNRGNAVQPPRRPKGKWGKRIVKLAALVGTVLLLYGAWGVWEDYRQQGYFDLRRSGEIAVARWQGIPNVVGEGINNRSGSSRAAPGTPRPVLSTPPEQPGIEEPEASTKGPAGGNEPVPTSMPVSQARGTSAPTEAGTQPSATSVPIAAFKQMPESTATPGPTNTPRPTPTPRPTFMPNPTPEPTLTPAEPLEARRQYMLRLVNNARLEHNLSPVILGDNAAAQSHAEAMLEGNFTGHWGLDGLTPNMRYTLAGGTNYMKENASGTVLSKGLNYRRQAAQILLAEHHEGLMNSSGHRKNILNKWHKRVNLGIACNAFACALVQNFEGDYVEFRDKPEISDNFLSFAGKLTGGFIFDSVQVWYDQPPHALTLGQLDATYSYLVGQVPATFLLEPAPPGYSWSASDLAPTFFTWNSGIDPYSVDPQRARDSSPFRMVSP